MSQFKSYAALTSLSKILNANESLRKQTHEKLNANVAFVVHSKKEGKEMVWSLRGKEDKVTLSQEKSLSDVGNVDITINIDDLNLKKLIGGKQSAQKLFMTGKLKIKGNVMKASFIEKLLKFAGKEKAKL
ncbi:hypothetical protein DAMA08_030150 [Martiniozyma asiatica (nom. inval.)]|nr:hypothetical protein DAMA08_030150 [Martiniozyma asiatica]